MSREFRPAAPPPAPRTLANVVTLARAAFAREPILFALGVSGLVIAALLLVSAAVRGAFIPPDGHLLDAATFSFGVGLFILTLALLLPLAGFSPRARRVWRRLSYVFWVFSFILEPLQASRGIDPRFAEGGSAIDGIMGATWGVTAGLVVILVVVFGLRFFRGDVLPDRPVLRLGIRYGVVAVWISFAIGILMTVVQGRFIGESGNLMLAHALGIHGIQAVPVAALLLTWAGTATRTSTWLHAAGIGWTTAVTASLAQALLGRPPMEASALTALTVAGLAVWAVAAAWSLRSWRQAAGPGTRRPATL